MVIGVSERQCYQIKARVTKRGAKGVVDGNRGRPCKRKTAEKEVRRIVELAKRKYRGFNDRHLTEKLAKQEKLAISRETVRWILGGAGIASPRKRRGNKHRSRRERKAAEGMCCRWMDPPMIGWKAEGGLLPEYNRKFHRGGQRPTRARGDLPIFSILHFHFS
jgi:hypothetical protein